MTKSATQLVHELATCTTCGEEHKPNQTGRYTHSWAAADGHSYRTKLFQLAGWSSTEFLEKLRKLAAS